MRIVVVDIGGTCIKSGIWEDGSLREIRETDTEAGRGGTHVMRTVLRILEEYRDFQAAGISTTGQVDTEQGKILYANNNMPGYTGMKIKENVEKMFHVPTAVQNDVNSAALGEAFYGAGKGRADFLCLTYGTGVGGAVIMDGKVYHGAQYSAGEFGGMITHPEDREPERDMFSGCYEKYASATALVQLVGSRFPELRNGRDIFASLDVPQVKGLVNRWIMEIVYGLVTLTHIFNPSLIVLGGGVMEQEYVVREVRARLEEQIMPSFRKVEIAQARLGNMAGLFGVAGEALKMTGG